MIRVLMVHNAYQQTGGEDSVVANEISLLKKHGHDVEVYFRHNDEIVNQSKLSLLTQTMWSKKTYTESLDLLKKIKPDIIHVHNTFPLVSPSLYWAAQKLNVPLVQTLHNFRLLCPQAMFLREGRICEKCIGKSSWRSIVHKCYRSSVTQSAALSGMLIFHHKIGTYKNKISRYIALNKFCRDKFIQGGLPAEKILVKPNFVTEFGINHFERSGFLFVGRLSYEKGVKILAKAFNNNLHGNLRIAGTGPEHNAIADINGIELLGGLQAPSVRLEMQKSVALILPSIWYENMPMTLVEAYANGLPVIASRIGALADLVEDGKTGLLFNAGDAADLAEKMAWAYKNPDAMAQMGRNARAKYLAEYTEDINYQILMNIYDEAIAACLK